MSVMVYIIVALASEAKPLIRYYELQRVQDTDLYLFSNDETLLLVCGIGYEKTQSSMEKLFRYRPITSMDVLINIGLCASTLENKIGELMLIDNVTYGESSFKLNIEIEHSHKVSALLSVKEPQREYIETLVDMEAHAILSESLKYMTIEQLLFIKIVSDYFKPDSLNKNLAYALINKKMKDIDSLIRKKLCQQQ